MELSSVDLGEEERLLRAVKVEAPFWGSFTASVSAIAHRSRRRCCRRCRVRGGRRPCQLVRNRFAATHFQWWKLRSSIIRHKDTLSSTIRIFVDHHPSVLLELNLTARTATAPGPVQSIHQPGCLELFEDFSIDPECAQRNRRQVNVSPWIIA